MFRASDIDFREPFAGLIWPSYLQSTVGLIVIAMVNKSEVALNGNIKTPFMLVGGVALLSISALSVWVWGWLWRAPS